LRETATFTASIRKYIPTQLKYWSRPRSGWLPRTTKCKVHEWSRLLRGNRSSIVSRDASPATTRSLFEKALRRVVAVEVIGKFGASRVKIERAIRT